MKEQSKMRLTRHIGAGQSRSVYAGMSHEHFTRVYAGMSVAII